MKTTKKHFELFKKEFKKWQKRFELSHWRVDFEHKPIGGRAEFIPDLPNCCAIVRLDTEWEEDEVTNEKIIASAKHEAIHMLCTKLYQTAIDGDYTSRDASEADEELVRKLAAIIN